VRYSYCILLLILDLNTCERKAVRGARQIFTGGQKKYTQEFYGHNVDAIIPRRVDIEPQVEAVVRRCAVLEALARRQISRREYLCNPLGGKWEKTPRESLNKVTPIGGLFSVCCGHDRTAFYQSEDRREIVALVGNTA